MIGEEYRDYMLYKIKNLMSTDAIKLLEEIVIAHCESDTAEEFGVKVENILQR